MGRNATATPFLESLCHSERMPRPLADWCLYEIQCGIGGTLDRLALAAALEGCCGIPNVHRETQKEPAEAALQLATKALDALWLWWPTERRAELLGHTRAAMHAGATAAVLTQWCIWRSTERAKRRADALNGPVDQDAEHDAYEPQDAATAHYYAHE